MVKVSKFDRLLEYIKDPKYKIHIKKAAAEQIGMLQKEVSMELSDILKKLYPLLMNCSFDTRVGAALAIRYLVPNCKPRRNYGANGWKTGRAYLKLSDFNFDVIRANPIALTHSEANHDKNADDYEKQIFEFDENSEQCEFCQFCELLIKQLASKNWFYRHGAAIALDEVLSNLSLIPKDYTEDLATKLIMLIMCDRFFDASVSDTVQLPVGQPASKLLARLLAHNSANPQGIIDQLLNEGNDWRTRFCGWLVIENMSRIDASIFDVEWLQNNAMRVLNTDTTDDTALDDVISIALRAVFPVVENLPNPEMIGEAALKKFLNYDETAPYNAIVIKVLQKLLDEDKYTDFVTNQFVDTLFVMLTCDKEKSGQDAAREAGYAMTKAIMQHVELEIWYDINMENVLLSIVDINIRERKFPLLANELFTVFKDVLDINGFDLREDYVVRVCSNFAKKENEYLVRLPNVIAILISMSKLVNINKEAPVFRGLDNAIAVCLVIIVCLSIPTNKPVFSDIRTVVFDKQPCKILMEMFDFKLKQTETKLDDINAVYDFDRRGAFKKFITKFIGQKLRNAKRKATVEGLVKACMAYQDYFFPEDLVDNSFAKTIAVRNMDPAKRASNPAILEEILKIGTFALPHNILDKKSLLQTYFYIASGQQIPNELVKQLSIIIFSSEDSYLSSFAAFVAKEYTKKYLEDFMVEFIPHLSEDYDFPVSVYEFIDLIVTDLPYENVHWCSFFVPILLKHQAVPDETIRYYCAHSLSQVVFLLPIEKVGAAPIPESLKTLKEESLKALRPLFDPTQITPLEIKPAPQVELRPYQREGVNWLGFLIHLGLNGILADDMGLGKTFQTLCAISTIHEEAIEKAKTIDMRLLNTGTAPDYPPVSLVVAPPAVVHHWKQEVAKFFPNIDTYPIEKSEDFEREKFKKFSGIVVTTYNFMVKFIDFINKRYFHFAVLDEGHVIKNEKTQKAMAAKKIKSQHRLILSGTPVQNDVTDLWALFDFLMPGYLGTKEEFNKRYANVISKMFDVKATDRDTQRGQKALDDLHLKVLPFIMRRLKIDYLSDLPPKIYMNHIVEMPPTQNAVYTNVLEQYKKADTFTKFEQEREVCIHPSLVDPNVMGSIENSGKLLSLKNLLKSVGIGNKDESTAGTKAIVFCEKTIAIDKIIELVVPSLKEVTYVRYDSTQTQAQKNDAIDNFMKEDGPDLFLATKESASLGINLTSANIVILFELNWNPEIDLQAVDRAHRIGQRRQVFVYQMIMKGTIDEKIADSQERKKAIIDNIMHDQDSMDKMETSQLVRTMANETDEPARELTLKEKIQRGVEHDESQYHQLD